MADGVQVVPYDGGRQVAQVSPAELLTGQFYSWEVRGRGWEVWDWPVVLEPPFRPFLFHGSLPAASPVDDARKPSALGSLLSRLRGQRPLLSVPNWPLDLGEVEPELATNTNRLVTLQLAAPPTLKVGREAAEQFLLSLSLCSRPVSFELVGVADRVVVQLVHAVEESQARQQLEAHFPDVAITDDGDVLGKFPWNENGPCERVVVEFGLSHEFMRPLRSLKSFDPDPLIAFTGPLSSLQAEEIAVLQVLFQPARQPWAESILRSVTDWQGRSFFADAPEMMALARAKVARPLFAAVIRVAVQSGSRDCAWGIARALGGALSQFSSPPSNELIPLSNDAYDDDVHLEDLAFRRSHRCGMLLNVEELASLVHIPSASVRAAKLTRQVQRTKAAPASARGHPLILGENVHAGATTLVTLGAEQRLRHSHILGATGTGKSHLLLNLIRQDLENGEGIAVLDPHGDLIDRVLSFVPENRVQDVVLLDPADEEYPIGFNILRAHSITEKNLLASDLVAVFRRLSTSWGDQMNSVLGNAIVAFLESDQGGTLADLRRFLVEQDFRRRFLQTVQDPEIVYYWEREFPLLTGKPQAPILTRLDSFLRPKPVRMMVSQKENRLDLGSIMNEGKIFLAKLAQGAIGEENAYLLGSFIVSKLHQLALARQQLPEAQRRPFYLYVDEFHHFVTPSMTGILTGARKYGLGLTLAHQDLRQLTRDEELSAAVLANAYTRICFRVGDADARKLEDGFSAFTAQDLQSLDRGEAICRLGQADADFNLRTLPLPEVDPALAAERRERVVAHSRAAYGTPRETVEAALKAAAQVETRVRPLQAETPVHRPPREERSTVGTSLAAEGPEKALRAVRTGESPRADHAEPSPARPAPEPVWPGRGGPQHKYLQQLIRRWAESRGYRVTVEQAVLDGLGSVDVALEKGESRIACEITISTPAEAELANVQKCLAAGFDQVILVSPERKTLARVRALVSSALEEEARARVRFCTPDELFAFLESRDAAQQPTEATVRGYKVKVQYQPTESDAQHRKRRAISQVVLQAMQRLRSKE